MAAADEQGTSDWRPVRTQAPAAAAASPPAGPPPQAPGVGGLTDYERNWAPWVHISALSFLVSIPLGNLLGPLVCWLVTKERSPFLDDQGKEALNFQIGVTLVLLLLGGVALMSFVLGFLILPIVVGVLAIMAGIVVAVIAIVQAIVAGIQAAKGVWYRYPFKVQFVK